MSQPEPRRGIDLGGLRVVCLIAALVLFILSALGVGHNLQAWGFVALTAAFLF